MDLQFYKLFLGLSVRGVKLSLYSLGKVCVILIPKYLKPDLDRWNGRPFYGIAKVGCSLEALALRKFTLIS